MKILQCACILGAVAALYSVAQRMPARAPALAAGETVALAALNDAHANLERDFAALAFVAADPMPVASLRARPSRDKSLRNTVVASADPNPVISARVIPVSAVASSPESKVLAFDDPRPDAYFDPTPIGPANPIVVGVARPGADLASRSGPRRAAEARLPLSRLLRLFRNAAAGETGGHGARFAQRRSGRHADRGDQTRRRRLRSGFRLHESRRQDRIRFRPQAAHRLICRALSAQQI